MSTDTLESLESFAARMGLTMETEQIGERPDGLMGSSATHYRCRIMRRHDLSEEKTGNREMTVFFSMGGGLTGEPELPDVLNCLASEIASVENEGDKWEWMESLDMVSRAGDEAWQTIQRQRDDLRKLLGREGLETLLWETERL